MPQRDPSGKFKAVGPDAETAAIDITELNRRLDALDRRRSLAWSTATVLVVALLTVCALLGFVAWLAITHGLLT